MKEKRRCKICDLSLSVYNKSDSCFHHHTKEDDIHEESSCTSRMNKELDDIYLDYYGIPFDKI